MTLPRQKTRDYFYQAAAGLSDNLEYKQNLGMQQHNLLNLMSNEIVIF